MRLHLSILLVVTLLIAGCTGSTDAWDLVESRAGLSFSSGEVKYTSDESGFWKGTGAWAKKTLDDLTLEQKVSQLFHVWTTGYYTSEYDPDYQELVQLVENFEIGGFIFSLGDALSQAATINDLQERSNVPLLISQDMEWGAAMRIRGSTMFPRAMAVGATRNPDYAYSKGYVTAKEARALGTHLIFAPVADINNNPENPVINTRSFGEHPDLVSEMVRAFTRGVEDAGAMATVKHFPGHGDTDVDSHLDLPIIPYDRARLDTLELVPFHAALEEDVTAVMTAHIAFPDLEPDRNVPATLSPRVIHDMLREEMGFEGLIVTDALDMDAIRRHFGTGEAAVRALEAGADLLLMPDDPWVARAAVLDAVKEGRISEERIDESVLRILRAKERMGLHEERLVDLNETRKTVATHHHVAASEATARDALTLIYNEDDLLPLRTPPRTILSIAISDQDNPDRGNTFAHYLRRYGDAQRVSTRLLDRRSTSTDYQAALRAAERADLVVVPSYIAARIGRGAVGTPARQREFLNALFRIDTPVVFASLGDPYISLDFDSPPTANIAAYSSSDASKKAVAQAIFGQTDFSGHLPVTLPGLFGFGHGIQLEQTMPRIGQGEEVGMDNVALTRIDSLMHAAIAERGFASAAVAIGRSGVVTKLDGYGHFTFDATQRVSATSRYDLASLTKVVATTTAMMKLYDEGLIALDDRVVDYLPDFAPNGKDAITIRHLLTHTSGLPAFHPYHRLGFTQRDAIIESIMVEKLRHEPGTEYVYSDLGMITLGLVIEQITGENFATYTRENLFKPMGMHHTGFRPVGLVEDSIVPTEKDVDFRGRLMQGEVHDETAWILGGTAGHAGLFSTARDLSRFAYMLVNEGRIGGKQFIQAETIRKFTTAVDPEHHTRALGWDTRSLEGSSSAGQHFGPRSFGHTGFTGTSIWVDPDEKLFVILLTNRVYPTRENTGHIAIRPRIADLAFEALRGEPMLHLPGLPHEPALARTPVSSDFTGSNGQE